MSYYIIFEKGGKFEIKMCEEAVGTVDSFQKFMDGLKEPYTEIAAQGRFSGEEFYFTVPLDYTEYENNTRPQAGSIAFNPEKEWKAVCIYWGDHIAEKKHYHNLFARIDGNLDELYEIGYRIWRHGEEKVTIWKEE